MQWPLLAVSGWIALVCVVLQPVLAEYAPVGSAELFVGYPYPFGPGWTYHIRYEPGSNRAALYWTTDLELSLDGTELTVASALAWGPTFRIVQAGRGGGFWQIRSTVGTPTPMDDNLAVEIANATTVTIRQGDKTTVSEYPAAQRPDSEYFRELNSRPISWLRATDLMW